VVNKRRSLLQAKILIQLGASPANSISALADRLSSQRPSVSRSLNGLKEQGLVVREKGEWRLTPEGTSELVEAQAVLADTIDQAAKATQRTTKVLLDVRDLSAGPPSGVLPPFNLENLLGMVRLSEQLQESVAAYLPITTSIDMLSQFGQVVHEMGQSLRIPTVIEDLSSVSRDMFTSLSVSSQVQSMIDVVASQTSLRAERSLGYWVPEIASALDSLISVQQRSSAMLATLLPSVDVLQDLHSFRQGNLLLSSTIDEMAAVAETSFRQSLMSTWDNSSWMVRELAVVSQTYRSLISTYLDQLDQTTIPYPQFHDLTIPPTIPVAWYAKATHAWIDGASEYETESSPRIIKEEWGDTDLDESLAAIDPDLVAMRRGSWNAYNLRGADWQRHASISQREMLTKLLRAIVPTDQLPIELRGKPAIKPRVRVILAASDKDAEFVEAVTEAVFVSYDQHNKYSHGNVKQDECLRGLMHTTEGLIRFLLALLNRPAPQDPQ
jgi:hypothetical protein